MITARDADRLAKSKAKEIHKELLNKIESKIIDACKRGKKNINFDSYIPETVISLLNDNNYTVESSDYNSTKTISW